MRYGSIGGSRVRSPSVPVVLSVYQRGSLLDGLAMYLSCDTKTFHDNESTHILHNFWTSTHSSPISPLAAPLAAVLQRKRPWMFEAGRSHDDGDEARCLFPRGLPARHSTFLRGQTYDACLPAGLLSNSSPALAKFLVIHAPSCCGYR